MSEILAEPPRGEIGDDGRLAGRRICPVGRHRRGANAVPALRRDPMIKASFK